MEVKYRIVLVENFPNGEPTFMSVMSLEAGKMTLKGFADSRRYTSNLYSVPGVRSYASLEFLDADGEWSYVETDT